MRPCLIRRLLLSVVLGGLILDCCPTPATASELQECDDSAYRPLDTDGLKVTTADKQLVQQVVRQMGMTKPQNLSWPPEVHVVACPSLQAYATLDQARKSYVIVFTGLLRTVVQGKPDRLAFLLGHEFEHIALGHVKISELSSRSEFLRVNLTRDQESDADKYGLEWALRAGYAYSEALKPFEIMRDFDEKEKPFAYFEALKSDHPPVNERLAALDKLQPELWRSMDDFSTGVYFLDTEQYSFAEDCFRSVTKRFPQSSDAWSNLGYAELMQYADALDERDLHNFGPGEIITGAFYRRPSSLEAQVRGINEDLWWKAVGDLKHSISLNSNLSASYESLGVAYFLRPAGPDAGTAQKYMEQAFELANRDKFLDAHSKLVLLVNLGVAAASGGDTVRSKQLFDGAQNIIQAGHDVGRSVEIILHYNQSLPLAASSNPEEQKRALKMMEGYLRQASPDSASWSIAYDEYSKLASTLHVEAIRQEELRGQIRRQYRPVTGIKVKNGRIRLAESLKEARNVLGPGILAPVIPNTNLVTVKYPSEGIELIANDKVLAIILTNDQHSVELFEKGLGSKQFPVKVGVKVSAIWDALGTPNAEALLDPEKNWSFYPLQGVAYQTGQDRSQITRIILVQAPDKE